MALQADQIYDNYQQVLLKVSLAANRVGRDPNEIQLAVVTKTQSVEVVRYLYEIGVRCFGENYVEEVIPKIESMSGSSNLQWHMIGHIQSRKAQLVNTYFDYIHSLDSEKVAVRLNHFAEQSGRKIPALIEVNLSGEITKYGFPAWDEKQWVELINRIRAITYLPCLQIKGLMVMPPYSENPESSRVYFQKLNILKDYCKHQLPHASLDELSMGMSQDYEIAIEEGATWVRIGQAILGPRSYKES